MTSFLSATPGGAPRRLVAHVVTLLMVILLWDSSRADAPPPQDYSKAWNAIKRNAENGDPIFEFMLGHLYLTGEGGHLDPNAGLKWLEKAGHKGEQRASLELGARLVKGDGLPQDYAAAARWFRIAAHQGLPDAAFNLAILYAQGHGVESDPVMALAWMSAAVAYLPWNAPGSRRADFVAARDAIAAPLSAEQRAAAARVTSIDGPLIGANILNKAELEQRGSAAYPMSMRALGRHGVVDIVARVGADGHVLETRIEGSSGYDPLDRETVKLMQAADVEPRRIDGQPVEAWALLHWSWVLLPGKK